MNYWILTAAILAVMATLGHFAVGYKSYLVPVLRSNVNIVPAKVMSSLFHYMSVFMVLTSIALLAFSFGETLFFSNPTDILHFFGITYAGFGIVQIVVAISSKIPMGLAKLFQWVFWFAIALCCFMA